MVTQEKTKKNKKYLTLSCCLLFLLSVISMGLNINFTKPNTDNFEAFASEVSQMISNYSTDCMEDITFNLETEVKNAEGNFFVSLNDFTDKTGDEVVADGDNLQLIHGKTNVYLTSNSNLVNVNDSRFVYSTQNVYDSANQNININEVAEALGYTVNNTDDSITLSRTFQAKRLIVKSSVSIDTSGAVAVASGFNNWYILQYGSEEETSNAYDKFLLNKNITYVEPDMIVTCEDDTDDTEGSNANVTSVTTDGSYYSWGASAMGVADYTEYLTNTVGTGNLTNQVVAVLDTGIDTDHAFFTNRITSNGKNFSSSTHTTGYSYEDYFGHGTHVSGTICDLTPSNVKIMPVKVLNDTGYGYTSGIVAGIEYVIQQKSAGYNVSVLNLSLGGVSAINSTDYNAYADAINDAYNAGIFSAVAAGNDGKDVTNYTPANVSKAITVAAVGYSNNTYYHPSWSNYGTYVDVCAPGYNIISAKMGGGTVSMSGTSMATPHVSASIALIRSDSTQNYTMTNVEDMLGFYAIDLGDTGWDDYYGYGMVNVGNVYADMLESLTFGVTNTVFTEPFDLTITCSDATASIYYTLDGSAPTNTNGTLYTAPVNINASTTVKAVAYVIENGEMTKCSQTKSITYYYYGTDVIDTFTVNANGELTAYTGDLTDVTIPSVVNGITVVAIGEQAFKDSGVEVIHLPTTVTKIGKQAFWNCANLTTVFAPEVNTIDMYAFAYCLEFSSLTDFYFPVLTTIGKYAFYDCYSLGSLTLTNLTSIDDFAFSMENALNLNTANYLTEINFPSVIVIGLQAFYNCRNLDTINVPNAYTICSEAFYGCSVENLTLQNTKFLGNKVFSGNTSLISANLPSVIFVGSECFRNCTNLSSLVAPNLLIISKYAFTNCDDLSNVNLPSLTNLGSYAFYDCDYLNTFSATELRYISLDAFASCDRLATLDLSGIINIGENAFNNCLNLTSVKLSAIIIEIADTSFSAINSNCVFQIYGGTVAESYVKKNNYNYTDLALSNSCFTFVVVNNSEIYITGFTESLPDDAIVPSYIQGLPVTKINANAFENCTKITELNMSHLVEIETNAFLNCTNLVSIITPNLTSVGAYAFSGCSALNSVDAYQITTLGNYAFYGCSALLEFAFGNNVSSIGDYALGYENTESGIIPTFIIYGYKGTVAETYATNHGITFYAIFNDLSRYYYNYYDNSGVQEIYIAWVDKNVTGNLILPSSYNGYTISKIGDEAFMDCAFISGIELPNSITKIGVNAFSNCTLLHVINLQNVTEIGAGAFSDCSSLWGVNLNSLTGIYIDTFNGCDELTEVNSPNVTQIGDNAFLNCFNLTSVSCAKLQILNQNSFANCYKLNSIDTDNITTIGAQAFYNCYNIKTVYLPAIITISSNAFAGSGLIKLVTGCDITSVSSLPTNTDLTIYGYSGTVIQTYAENQSIEFVVISSLGIIANLDDNYDFYQSGSVNSLGVLNNGFEVTYKWYQSTDNTTENGTDLNIYTQNLSVDTSSLATYYYYVVLTNWDGATVTSNVAMVTITTAPFTFEGDTLTSGVYGSNYSIVLNGASDGSGNFTYNLYANQTLPAGLALNNLTLSGIPTSTGVYAFIIEATDTTLSKEMLAEFSITILPKDITVTITDKSSIYGESLVDLTSVITVGTLYNDNDDLGISLTKADGITVGTYTITGESTNTNYNVTFVDGYYSITPRPVTITISDQTGTYGETIIVRQTAYRITSTYTPAILLGDSLGITLIKAEGANVGEYDITGNYINTNYLVTFVNGIYTIQNGTLSYTATNFNGSYDGAYHFISVDVNESYNATITYGIEAGNYIYNSSITDNKYKNYTARTYTIYYHITATNYNDIYGSATITINKASVTINIDNQSSNYGEDLVDLTYTVSAGEIYGNDNLQIILSKDSGTTVGSYNITGTFTSTNYLVTFVNGVYEIIPACLSVSIDNKTSNFSEAMETLTYQITSGQIYYNDDLGIVLTTSATNSSALGEYEIRGAWNNANYNITFVNGTYTITKSATSIINVEKGVLVDLGNNYVEGMTLVVNYSSDISADLLESAKNQGYDLRSIYQISIMLDGEQINLSNDVMIKITYTTEMSYLRGLTICDISNEDAITSYSSNMANGFLTFSTNELDNLSIATPCATREELNTIISWLVILVVGLVLIICISIYYNIKHEKKSRMLSLLK